ncbi:tetracycline resistance MFS efflux pump [Capsulimonas corticalis]|uniref:Tetracycline resistance MFS efflux pump n=1 Tax=Capsulimonas corticalis TaxID=2219043 RepID=A0A402CXM4_9BACT|nr:tetracycline resistance MFS efflux pump [Capsulimonas corticalis]
MQKRPASLVFIFITLLIDVLGFGVIIPVLPRLVSSLTGHGPSAGAHVFGLLMACFGLMQFLFSPLLGSLSDRYGRRPVLLLSLLFTVVDYVIQALAPTIEWLFVGRILAGITGASFTVANAYIADVTPPEKRAQSYGMIGAAFGIGFILGPAAGGLLGAVSPRAPFWAAAGLSLLNCIYGAFVLPESLAPENRRALSAGNLNPLRGFGILARFPWVLAMAASIGLLSLAQQCLQSTWVLYTTYRYHWTPIDNGLSLALIGLMTAIVQVGLIRVLVPKLGERRAVLVGFLFNVVGYLGFALASKGWMMYPVLIVWCLSGIAGPTIQGLLSKQYEANEQGAVQGALASLQSLTGVVGPILATWIFGYFTGPTTPKIIPGSPFFLGAVLIIGAGVLARGALRRQATTAPA